MNRPICTRKSSPRWRLSSLRSQISPKQSSIKQTRSSKVSSTAIQNGTPWWTPQTIRFQGLSIAHSQTSKLKWRSWKPTSPPSSLRWMILVLCLLKPRPAQRSARPCSSTWAPYLRRSLDSRRVTQMLKLQFSDSQGVLASSRWIWTCWSSRWPTSESRCRSISRGERSTQAFRKTTRLSALWSVSTSWIHTADWG